MSWPTAAQIRLRRRDAMTLLGCAWLGTAAKAGEKLKPGAQTMRITCLIRYQIDPVQREGFEAYAEAWSRIIPRCGGHLIGYFLPYEGTNDVAWGLIALPSLAEYEAYRVRLKADPEARANLDVARSTRLILREERTFLQVVDNTFERPALAGVSRG